MNVTASFNAAIDSIESMVHDYAEDVMHQKAEEICNWINYQLSVTEMEVVNNDRLADEDLVQVYDPDHAQLRISHMSLHISEIYHAEVEYDGKDLACEVVIKSNDGRDITDEMDVSLTMSINNAMKMVGS